MSAAVLTRIATFVSAAELPIVLAISPLLMFPSGGRVAAAALVPVVWACAWATTGRVVPRTALNWALGLLLIMAGVSLLATFDVGSSLGKVSGLLLGVVLFFALARWLTTSERLRVAVVCFSAAGAGLAMLGLIGTPGARKFAALHELATWVPLAVRGIPGAEDGFNPNAVAGALVLFLPLQVVLLSPAALRWLRFSPRQRTIWWTVVAQGTVFGVTALGVLLMQSRSAWAGLAAAGLGLLCWTNRRFSAVVLATGAVAALLAVAFGLIPAGEFSQSWSDQMRAGNLRFRAELWSGALEAIRDAPVTGMGMNTFRAIQPVRYAMFPVPSAPDIAHAHNHLLQAALDLGLPGLIAYLAVWILAGLLLMSTAAHAADPALRNVAGGVAAGLAAQFVFGLTDAIPIGAKVGVFYWAALGMAVGLHTVGRGLARRSRR